MEKHARKVPVLKKVLKNVQHLRMEQGRRGKFSSRRCTGEYKNS
jgi:hypothetical protein